MKFFTIFILLFIVNATSMAQVGINTETPQGALDVDFQNKGLLLPRVQLDALDTATPVVNPDGGTLPEGTMVYHTGHAGNTLGRRLGIEEAGYYYWMNGQWRLIKAPVGRETFMGTVLPPTPLPSATTVSYTMQVRSLPFKPRRIEFTAMPNIPDVSTDIRSGAGNDQNNVFGIATGYASRFYDGNPSSTIQLEQRAIYNGGNGASINDKGKMYLSNSCIGIYYVNSNGAKLTQVIGRVTAFTDDGFDIEFTRDSAGSQGFELNALFYTAYKY